MPEAFYQLLTAANPFVIGVLGIALATLTILVLPPPRN